MLFNTIHYACFLPLVLLVHWLLPRHARCPFLLIASYYFYMSWNAAYGLLLLGTTVITYACGLLIEHSRQRGHQGWMKAWLTASLVINLAMLFYFKYFNFFLQSVTDLRGLFTGHSEGFEALDILLPVGISFFIFQALGYTIDVYRGADKKGGIAAERNFIHYALFVSFFPQLVAGPIERSRNLLTQIKTPRQLPAYDERRAAWINILWGLMIKMVIADRIAIVIQPAFSQYNLYNGVQILLAVSLFAIQIYCDFGGYSLIAIGSAKLLGFTLMDNFKTPYFAVNIKDFWDRWHISLTSWFRDYIYIPLGGNRKGVARKCLNIMIVFFISGLWHGAEYRYVVWGLLNGLFLVGHELWQRWKEKRGIADRPMGGGMVFLCRARTFALVSFTWLFFRARSVPDALNMLRIVFKRPGVTTLFKSELFSGFENVHAAVLLFAMMLLLALVDNRQNAGQRLETVVARQSRVFRWIFYTFLIFSIILFGIYGGGGGIEQPGFIYFQF